MFKFLVNYPLFCLFLILIFMLEIYRITDEILFILTAGILFLGLYFLRKNSRFLTENSEVSFPADNLICFIKISPYIYLVFSLAIMLLIFRFSLFTWQNNLLEAKIENNSVLTGEIVTEEGSGYVLRLADMEGYSYSLLSGRFFYAGQEQFEPGEILLFVQPRLEKLYICEDLPGDKARWLTKGVKYNIAAPEIISTIHPDERTNFSPNRFNITSLRNYLSTHFDNYFPRERANLLKALLLGKRGLNQEAEKLLRRAGAGHVLALSGLHIGFVALFCTIIVNYLAKITGFSVLKFTSIFLILGYVVLAGASPSLLRAGIMSISWILLLIFNKNSSSLNILGLAGTIILLLNPYYLYMISFQLSFFVIVAIIFYLPIFKKFFPSPVALSISAQIGAQPLLIYLGGELNLNGLIANLVLIPLLGPIIFLNLIFMIGASISDFLAGLLAPLIEFLLSPFMMLAGLCAELPFILKIDWLESAAQGDLAIDFFLNLPVLSLYLILLLIPFIYRPAPVSWLKEEAKYTSGFIRMVWLAAVLYFLFFIIL